MDLVGDGEQNQKAIQNRRLGSKDLFQPRTQAELIDIRSERRLLNLAFFYGGNNYWQEIALEFGRGTVPQQEKRGPRTVIANQVAAWPTILFHDRTELVGILFARRSQSLNDRVTRFIICDIVLQTLLLLGGKFD